MPEIFVKEFSEIATIETIKKAKEIAKQKNREGYSPEKDFYKILRDHIKEMHKNELDVEYIDNALKMTTHAIRKKHYADMIIQYKKWLKKKKIGSSD